MPLNIPTVTAGDISFGPARFFLGASGATPTVDVGAISEDGVSLELAFERREIRQGNPGLVETVFTQTQDAMLRVTSIEWDVTSLAYALGAGVTASSASLDTLEWGGDPVVLTVAAQIQHQMASGQTLNVFGWKCYADQGFTVQMAQDEHQFGFGWKLMRSATNWGGTTLAYNKQLFQIQRLKT